MGSKNQQPAAFSPDTGLFYVPVTQLCMDFEPFRVTYTAGQPFVGATLAMYPPQGERNSGNFIAWNAKTGKIVWSKQEQFAVWSGALATAGGVVFYGTLEGYLKAVDANTGRELYKFKTQSGIVGNVMTYENRGKQYVAVLSGIGGWPGIGLAAGLTNPTDGLGATGAFAALRNYTSLGGSTHRVRAAVRRWREMVANELRPVRRRSAAPSQAGAYGQLLPDALRRWPAVIA
jgi:glucose dehydrogenase